MRSLVLVLVFLTPVFVGQQRFLFGPFPNINSGIPGQFPFDVNFHQPTGNDNTAFGNDRYNGFGHIAGSNAFPLSQSSGRFPLQFNNVYSQNGNGFFSSQPNAVFPQTGNGLIGQLDYGFTKRPISAGFPVPFGSSGQFPIAGVSKPSQFNGIPYPPSGSGFTSTNSNSFTNIPSYQSFDPPGSFSPSFPSPFRQINGPLDRFPFNGFPNRGSQLINQNQVIPASPTQFSGVQNDGTQFGQNEQQLDGSPNSGGPFDQQDPANGISQNTGLQEPPQINTPVTPPSQGIQLRPIKGIFGPGKPGQFDAPREFEIPL